MLGDNTKRWVINICHAARVANNFGVIDPVANYR
jgi:hypothetical protein